MRKRANLAQVVGDPTGRIYYNKSDIFCEAVGTVLLLLIIFIMFCAVFWLSTHYAKPITGSSMQPGINNYTEAVGDIAIVSSTDPYFYGDIVIIDMERTNNQDPEINKRLLIKRAIAFGGDSLRLVQEGSVYYFELKKSGENEFERLIEDDYAYQMTSITKAREFENQTGWTVKLDKASDGSITIPEGYAFFCGDNRNSSYDSRKFGPIESDACIGVVETILKKDNFWNKFFSAISSIFNVKHTEAF